MEQIQENLESIGCERIENMEQENHPWNYLSTVTTFDEGITCNLTSNTNAILSRAFFEPSVK